MNRSEDILALHGKLPPLEQFKFDFFENSTRDGPRFSVLDSLNESEREEAEILLIRALTPDAIYKIQALGYLRSQKAFTPLLELLPHATGTARVYVAQALWRINRYEPAVEILCKLLTKRRFFMFRDTYVCWHAAEALKDVDDARAIEALRIGLKDKDTLINSHSRNSLAVLLGIHEQYEAIEENHKEKKGSLVIITAEGTRKAMKEQDKLLEDALDNYDKSKEMD